MLLLLLLGLALAAACAIYFHLIAGKLPADPVAQFLSVHWAQPIAPQGDPPPGFSAIEASLAPETCAACHVAQYADWSTSLHSKAMGPGIRWQLRVMNQSEANDCLRCHAPLAEQKALVALEQGWANAPTSPMPAYVSADLHRRGNTCASCHVRRHQRFGPPSQMRNPKLHGGFVAQQAFRDSRFCAPCHQFPAGARSLKGKLIENTYEEWRSSPAAREGSTCQTCHMPDGRHIWRGIHDPEVVRKGLRRELEVKRLAGGRLEVLASITAPGVGHYFPTYVVPKVLVSLHLLAAGKEREIARLVIGRTVSVDMDREWSDTRIPPGGRSQLSAQVMAPPVAYRIEMRMEIEPGEHYARMYRAILQKNPDMDATTQVLLREALRETEAANYSLDNVVVAGPTKLGEVSTVISN
ncbi:MAG: multiheme c-type cytochrome [Sulfuricella sp.]